MNKKVLVIGGSYFAGRVFNILSSREGRFDITVINRGTTPLRPLNNVACKVCDRHDEIKLSQVLNGMSFDAVIDFCGYAEGDTKTVLNAITGRTGQYIFISTSSVYEPEISWPKLESDRIRYERTNEVVDKYIGDKALLELECMEQCRNYGIPYTIVRPAFIYGPFNYAPRESWYIQRIVKGEPIPVPVDSRSRFSFLYVSDLAHMLQSMVGNPAAHNDAFNGAGPEEISYSIFMEVLKKVSDRPFSTEETTVKEVLEKNIPLPFPLDQNDLVDGRKAQNKLGVHYTPFLEGMKKTFEIFRNVYTS